MARLRGAATAWSLDQETVKRTRRIHLTTRAAAPLRSRPKRPKREDETPPTVYTAQLKHTLFVSGRLLLKLTLDDART